MNLSIKLFVWFNSFVFRLTGGRLGSQMGRQSVLLLHTIGRKSGKPHVTPLSYYRDGESYLLVASNWGKEHDPDWFRNLMQQPHATIQVKNETFRVQARQAGREEHERLWKLVTSRNPQYLNYQRGLARELPIVILSAETDSSQIK